MGEVLRPELTIRTYDEPLPLTVSGRDGEEVFRVTPELRFEWGPNVDVDETARLIAESICLMLGRSLPV